MTRRPRGFTLIEMLIAMVVLAVLGVAMTKLLTSQGRFYDHETNLRKARSISRASSNILLSDLRMVQDSGGVDSASSNGRLVRIRVPYRFGLVCGTTGATTTVSMLPADSAEIALAVYAGFAWRAASGLYTYVAPSNPTAAAPVAASTPQTCTNSGSGQAQIRTLSMSGRTGALLDLASNGPSGATQAAPVFFWQEITYAFAGSAMYPGKVGLYRNVQGGANEEIMAPFDTSARFRYYQTGDDTSRTIVPTLKNIRGIAIVLNALSPNRVSDDSSGSRSKITTSVFFKNVRSF
jgi:prepilin-type N-terminal cleavage/methylation domain-containing protein